jgi:hypothetical protein
MSVSSKPFLVALGAAVACGAATPAHAEVREGGAGSCAAEQVSAVEEALEEAPLGRHCEAMQARFADLDLTYGELMYRHAKQRRDVGIAMLAVLTPAFGAASIGLGVAAYRKREAAEENEGTTANFSGSITELGAVTGATILGIAAVACLFAGISMVPSGAERMRLLDPLLTSDPSTWKTRESAESSLSPRFDPESGGLALSISF